MGNVIEGLSVWFGAPTVRVMRCDSRACVPRYMTPGAAGFDLCACLSRRRLSLAPGAVLSIPTGLRVAIPEGYEMQIRPRSGLAFRHRISVVNSPGTIDSDYRGEIMVLLINHGEDIFTIEHGKRIAQGVVTRCPQVYWRRVATLDDTLRGSGGFGSTG